VFGKDLEICQLFNIARLILSPSLPTKFDEHHKIHVHVQATLNILFAQTMTCTTH